MGRWPAVPRSERQQRSRSDGDNVVCTKTPHACRQNALEPVSRVSQ